MAAPIGSPEADRTASIYQFIIMIQTAIYPDYLTSSKVISNIRVEKALIGPDGRDP